MDEVESGLQDDIIIIYWVFSPCLLGTIVIRTRCIYHRSSLLTG